MRLPAKWPSCRGLLLLEAILSAIVITTGLVFVSRALSSQLNTLRALEERDLMASLAHAKLAEMESIKASGQSLSPEAAGRFDTPYERFDWSISAAARDVPLGEPALSDVIVTVRREQVSGAGLRVFSVWPGSWIPAEWPSQ